MEMTDKLRQLKLDRAVGVEPTLPPTRAPMRHSASAPRYRKLATGAVLVGVAVAAFSFGQYSGTAGSGERAAVEKAGAAAPARPASVAASAGFTASGHVVARRQATIAAQTTGMIRSIEVEEGQWVGRNTLIARLDAQSMVAGLDQANADVAAASADIDQLSARRHEAVLNERRFSALADRGFARLADVERARADLAAADAGVRRARAQLSGQAAERRAAAVSLDRANIRAPFAGIVIRLNAQPGEIISPVSAGGGFTRTGICTIVDMNSLEIEVDVAETQIAAVAAGQPTRITLQAYPDRQYAGRVIAVVPIADRARASFRVRVAIDRTDNRMLPEMAARVHFGGQVS